MEEETRTTTMHVAGGRVKPILVVVKVAPI